MATTIDGYPTPILQVWDHQIATRTSTLMPTNDIGSMHYRPRLMLELTSLPVTALPRMTISILSRKSRTVGLFGHHCPSSNDDWEMFTPVLCYAVTVTSNT